MRIAIVQFGDYREAYSRFRNGGAETYYAQRYSVEFVERLAERCEFVGVCAMLGDAGYETALSDRLHAACVPRRPRGRLDEPAIISLLERWKPTHLILQTPSARLVRWALARRVRLLPVFADSWEGTGIRGRARAALLAFALNDRRVAVVGNHNVPASRSLRRIGVAADKIIPWDWPHALTPEANPPKSLGPGPASLLYVGQLTRAKGCADCIDAAALLKARGVDFKMTFVGGGDFERGAREMVAALDLGDRVVLAGRQPHDRVVEMLRGAAISLAPSHHSYPEGLPMTIYEALATRTPIVMSDHPMFLSFFAAATATRMVPERRPDKIADAIASLLADAGAYQRASEDTGPLWRTIKRDLTWGALIDTWLADPEGARAKLQRHSLHALDR